MTTTMKYQIETKSGSEWRNYEVGEPNEFDSYEEAASMIAELARTFGESPSLYRVVEKHS